VDARQRDARHRRGDRGRETATLIYLAPRDATPRGLVKIVFERGSRRLLGLHALVKGGAELVQGYALAMRLGATVDDIAGQLYAFPTMGEAVHYTAEAAVAGASVAR